MRTQLIILALMLSLAVTNAQEKKQMSVRVKKIENINGVEKVTDTTYITDDISSVLIEGLDVRMSSMKNNGDRRIMIVNHGKDGLKEELRTGATLPECDLKRRDSIIKMIPRIGKTGSPITPAERILILDSERELNGEERMALIEAGKALRESQKGLYGAGTTLREANKDLQEMEVLLEKNDLIFSKEMAAGAKPGTAQRIIIIRELKTRDVTKEEEKMLEKTTGITDGRLNVHEMKFYPNPNDGKFNLSFNLPDKGDTKIEVLNPEGKSVYNEQLYDFTGAYSRDLDISRYPKGVYFVRVEQNKHAQVKKIVLE